MWNKIKSGEISAIKTKNNRWYVDEAEINRYLGASKSVVDQGVAIYARVSSVENKEDLERQVVGKDEVNERRENLYLN